MSKERNEHETSISEKTKTFEKWIDALKIAKLNF